jgi:hypothetical protein
LQSQRISDRERRTIHSSLQPTSPERDPSSLGTVSSSTRSFSTRPPSCTRVSSVVPDPSTALPAYHRFHRDSFLFCIHPRGTPFRPVPTHFTVDGAPLGASCPRHARTSPAARTSYASVDGCAICARHLCEGTCAHCASYAARVHWCAGLGAHQTCPPPEPTQANHGRSVPEVGLGMRGSRSQGPSRSSRVARTNSIEAVNISRMIRLSPWISRNRSADPRIRMLRLTMIHIAPFADRSTPCPVKYGAISTPLPASADGIRRIGLAVDEIRIFPIHAS